MTRSFLLMAMLSLCLASCWQRKKPIEPPQKMVLGYKPVYTTDSSILRIVADTARRIKTPGKVYAFGKFLLQCDNGEGIHVLDMSDPAQVKNLGFLRIKGASEISIKGSYLYTNSYTDLVVVDISDWKQPVETKRVKNAFQQGSSVTGFYQFIPLPEHNVYYECTGPRTGYQTGWVKDSVSNYNCFYP